MIITPRNFQPAFKKPAVLLRNASRMLIGAMLCFVAGCVTQSKAPKDSWPLYKLQAEATWQLNLPRGERFDASGLLLMPDHRLLTINDRGPSLYEIQFLPAGHAADLVELPGCFTSKQLQPFASEKIGRYDSEGIARDELGRLYICEEANRWVLRCDPQTKKVERLKIDWSPVQKYFSTTDLNASFEGIAVSSNKIYLANERKQGRIIAVDLSSLKVVDSFVVRPSGAKGFDVHYSDLCWFEDALFVLLRESRVVLKVDPARHRVLAQYDFRGLEADPKVVYFTQYFFVGTMEGLAVDRENIWLVTDNNGLGRVRHPTDIRPTLFKCRRPDLR